MTGPAPHPVVPGRPPAWRGPLREVDRLSWSPGAGGDPGHLLQAFLDEHGLGAEVAAQRGGTAVALLLGAAACERLAGFPPGRPTPAPGVPDLVAVALRPGEPRPAPAPRRVSLGPWRTTWTAQQHAEAVRVVQAAIARGEVYQANVVGHRCAPYQGDGRRLAAAVGAPDRGAYAGWLCGPGWAVGCASPEQLVRVDGDRVTTEPVKGTSRDPAALRASAKDRAEHVMIVDLERNDLARVARTGSVEVERLYALEPWSDLWHASSRVAARLAPGVGVLDLLAALAPGGSVTGAPKRAACRLLADLEPVGRGPAMGAFGLVWPGGLDLGLTIRTVAVDADAVHLWAGGGITWSSDPDAEVAEAEAKAAPVLAALSAATGATG